MTETIVGLIFAIVLVVLVVRDLIRVRAALASVVAVYSIVMAVLAYRGLLLSTAERLPPASLIAGQFLMLLLIASTLTLGTKAWREIEPMVRVLTPISCKRDQRSQVFRLPVTSDSLLPCI